MLINNIFNSTIHTKNMFKSLHSVQLLTKTTQKNITKTEIKLKAIYKYLKNLKLIKMSIKMAIYLNFVQTTLKQGKNIT